MSQDVSYYRLMLGPKSIHASECIEGDFIGVDVEIRQDLGSEIPDNLKDFNARYRPLYLEANQHKTKVAAGLACGALWAVAEGMKPGDIVLCPDGAGSYHIAEVNGEYQYRSDAKLFHTRGVRWLEKTVKRSDMSQLLKNSSGSAGTFCNISKYASELSELVGLEPASGLIATDESVEDPTIFALEKHLEDFLVQNWEHTELGKSYDIYEDEHGNGQQYKSDTGPLDILAVSKDGKELLVVELKKGRASDSVVGQIQRYMGYVQEELCEEGQTVRGVIIALEDNLRIKRALAVADRIEFYRYKVSFNLFKV